MGALSIYDTHIYIPLEHGNKHAIKLILDCFGELKLWLETNFLCLNESKTELIVFAPNEQCVHYISVTVQYHMRQQLGCLI